VVLRNVAHNRISDLGLRRLNRRSITQDIIFYALGWGLEIQRHHN
jgi:hypothetical protein